jgi:3-hydroxybutyryl-CoA dehydrogenase
MTAAGAPIAVVGAGLMGHGIAQVFACAGHAVTVHDPVPAALATLRERVAANLRRLGLAEAALERISACVDLDEAVGAAAFVFEAAPEDVTLKQALIEQITSLAPTDAVVASNTSSMPVATYVPRAHGKERVIGAHWWNPPYLIPLVEVVEGEQTSLGTVARTMDLLTAVGKLPVHVRKDVPGFVANRLQHALWREAMSIVQNGICDAETVDLCVKNSFGLRLSVMGPLETADLGGLDLVLNIHEQILPFIDRTPGPLPILKDKVDAGDLGMKTGRGFRTWTADEAKAAHVRLSEHLAAALAARSAGRRPAEQADRPAGDDTAT